MDLRELIKKLEVYRETKPVANIDVTGLQMDSRKVQPGDLFVCIKGFTVDGHEYAKDAENKGAVAVIAEKKVDLEIPEIIVNDSSKALSLLANKYFNYPTKQMNLIGVTGTNGKTSVTYLLDEIFREFKQKTGLIGTIQMKIDDDVFPVQNTTPDALFLQKNFALMAKRDIETVLMEVSSHALDLGRVHGCDYDIAVFTNLSQDHLDYHDSMSDYLWAKSLLFSQLGNDQSKVKFAVINKDDPYSDKLIKVSAQPVITYGIDTLADVTADNIKLTANGSEFTIKSHKGNILVKSKLMGKFSVYNMLAATAAALCKDVPLETIQTALEKTVGVSGRFEPVIKGQSFGVIVDYAHTPDSLENVLRTIRSFAKRKVFVVVGCGGDRDKTKRPLMASIAAEYADHAIFTSDNPRSEDPNEILSDMVNGIKYTNYETVINREEAINNAIQYAQPEDVVLIAGKGHETYQIIGNQVFDFDDREVAKSAVLKKLNGEK